MADKSKIPTSEIVVGSGNDKVTINIYRWLTQSEEEERQRILVGDQKMTMTADEAQGAEDKIEQRVKRQITIEISTSSVLKHNKFLVEHLCENLNYEDFEVWHPSMRAELITKLNDSLTNTEKKSLSQPSSSDTLKDSSTTGSE